MPNRNGTGPQGKGPKTGRGVGNCSDDVKTGQENETQEEVQSNEDCGQGRGLKPCGQYGTFNTTSSDSNE